nr:MAG TPA: hypothetical protein [Caudoviricetes sp.]
MEQKDIDIYEILKGMPDGTPLYTPLCGNVEFTSVVADKNKSEAIWTENKNGELSFNKNGKWMEGGEVLLFPSKEMRDWSKFAWKKGDILVLKDGTVHIIFEGFEDDTYRTFKGKYYLWEENGHIEQFNERQHRMETSLFFKANDDAKTYINTIEKHLGGKLNPETLEIEKLSFEIGKLYVFDEQDEDGDVTVIGELIGKDESTLTFGTQYEIETEKFVVNQAFDLNISLHKELREATEDETFLFREAYAQWQEKEKKAMAQPDFKPFDKVLVRNRGDQKWMPAFFVRDRGEEDGWRYNVLPIHSGKSADFISCILFEGNEYLAFTDEDFKDLPF